MNSEKKQKILSNAKEQVTIVCAEIKNDIIDMEKRLQEAKANFRSLPDNDRVVAVKLMKYNEKRIGELTHLKDSPYFVRCDVIFDGEKK